MEAENVIHPFEPVFDANSRVLVLGTMPSPRSREEGFYYGHPQNRFWRVLSALLGEPLPKTNERKADFALRNHIALWDVLASCQIEGASDTSIASPRANDIGELLDKAPIEAVFCTGAKAFELYEKMCLPHTGMPAVRLPSPSSANAASSLNDLMKAYRPLLDHLHPFTPPVLSVPDVVQLEQTIANGGTPLDELMDRAGLSLSHVAHECAPESSIVILCGSGNNGGDGWVAAADLVERGHDVTLVSSKAPDEIRAWPASDAAPAAAAVLAGSEHARVALNPDETCLGSLLEGAGLVIDAILGTGFDGANVKEPYATWIRKANAARRRGTLVIAADVPSGFSARTGNAADPCICADRTVTMIAPKTGLTSKGAEAFCGNMSVASLAYIEPLLGK